MEKKCVGTSEAAKQWGLTQETIANWCRQGKIPAEHDGTGKPWRIPVGTKNPIDGTPLK